MTKRVVFGALVSALMMVATGCAEECVDRIDCRSKKGEPGEGKEWVCRDNKCESQDSPSEPGADAGTEPDAGTGTDAGTEPDAGTGTDAGTEPDAGTMTLAEGAGCTATDSCMAGLTCEGATGARTCQPLHIAVTVAGTGATTDAVVVRYKTPGSEPATGTSAATKLSESTTGGSRFPRWNKDGTAVAFVQEGTGSTVALVTRNIPLAAGQVTELTTGANAGGTIDFRHLEWEPSASLAWSTVTKAGSGEDISGISVIAGTGTGTVQTATTEGVFPSWAADGNSFVYSVNSLGLNTKPLSGAGSAVTGPALTSEQPLHNKANGVLLYLDAKGATETIGGVATPLTELFTFNPAATGTPAPQSVAAPSPTDIAVPLGQLNSFIANHTWAPDGTHVAYVRVYYFKPAVGEASLCSGGTNCQGKQANVIYVRRIDANGAPQEAEMELASVATLPSFSPDGQFIAYLSGGKLLVQRINPAATDAASLKVGGVITHTWSGIQSNRGDDHRPRWQPR
ncbi:hypothetical protein NR798_13405 [Archangium gephyra]|uniref:hypothetical protein n=1 Tax=Archangium gephyra TaxID=48 RepID=UPI0035D43FB3